MLPLLLAPYVSCVPTLAEGGNVPEVAKAGERLSYRTRTPVRGGDVGAPASNASSCFSSTSGKPVKVLLEDSAGDSRCS